MQYLEFDKKELINLEYSLSREILRTNRAGSYASTTLVGCNTRKYHGLLICPMEHLDDDRHVLLSSLDLSIIYGDNEFNLGIHKYDGDVYQPGGHKYVQDFQFDVVPKVYYRIGGVKILQERVLVEKEQQMLIRYTVLESENPITLKFTPFLAFRNIHQLSKANMHINTRAKRIENGIKMRLYDGYAWLYMQFSNNVEYVHVPDWFYNIEYTAEQKRGYECHEDLFVPGFFEATAKQGDSIVFSASTELASPSSFKRKVTNEIKKRIPRDGLKNCLLNSAGQFIVKIGKRTEIVAGYHWNSGLSRDAFMSLPGLTLLNGNQKSFFEVVNTIVPKLKDGLFPEVISEDVLRYHSVDTPLWFFWCLQQYTNQFGNKKMVWKNYGKALKSILKSYKKGTHQNIYIQHNGLLYAGGKGQAVTWMNFMLHGKAVAPRIGCPVEVNALWYNAVCYALEIAKASGDAKFVKEWGETPSQFEKIFIDSFWDDERHYLADVVDSSLVDWNVRPNQIIAASMPYSPLNKEMKNCIAENVKRFLLTPRGVRSLSPKHPDYKGRCTGNQEDCDQACHQGAAWPWLLEFYAETYLQIHGLSGLEHVKRIVSDISAVVNEHGIGSISEVYDGDPPYKARGAISNAMNVAAMLRIIDKVENLELTKS